MIQGINHITLAVRDLDKSFTFYTKVLAFRPLARWDKGAYLLAETSWVCLTLDPETRTGPLDDYTHTAFTVSEKEFQNMSDRITRSGTKQWQENNSEGNSLYFLDPNGHKLEIHTGDWQSRLTACRNDPFPGMLFFD